MPIVAEACKNKWQTGLFIPGFGQIDPFASLKIVFQCGISDKHFALKTQYGCQSVGSR